MALAFRLASTLRMITVVGYLNDVLVRLTLSFRIGVESLNQFGFITRNGVKFEVNRGLWLASEFHEVHCFLPCTSEIPGPNFEHQANDCVLATGQTSGAAGPY